MKKRKNEKNEKNELKMNIKKKNLMKSRKIQMLI